MNSADVEFTSLAKRYEKLGKILIEAETYYGLEGRKAFATRFPVTANTLRNLEYIGRGSLMAVFALCSDKFIKGLINLPDSMSWQLKLVAGDSSGINVLKNGKIVKMKYEDFIDDKADALFSIIDESDKDISPDKLRDKIRNNFSAVRSKFAKKTVPRYIIKGGVVKFNRGKFSVAELRKIIAELEAAE